MSSNNDHKYLSAFEALRRDPPEFFEMLHREKEGASFSLAQFNLLVIGFSTSFIIALLGIKFLIRFIQAHTFTSFDVYRIALVIIWFVVL